MVFSSVKVNLYLQVRISELYEDFVVSHQNDELQLFAQAELNDLVRKLDLPKCSAELLGPQLKEKNMLASKNKVSFYRYRKKDSIKFFKMEENLLFCDNIEGLVASKNKVSFYRYRKKDSIKFFKMEKNLLFCDNIEGLITTMRTSYIPLEWRLFIDSSKRSMKCVLLHNGNKLAFILIEHSIQMKETYENMFSILNKIKYVEHKWIICGNLNVLSMLLG